MNFKNVHIPAFNRKTADQAAARQQTLTKPLGSMGDLETLSIQIAGMTGDPLPDLKRKAVFLMAADHGVCAEGVSPYPQSVTPQMVMNFLNHGAAINVLTQQLGAEVWITDIGVAYDFDPSLPIAHRKVARGTMNIAVGPAMTAAQLDQALTVGYEIGGEAFRSGVQLAATGEMGIGNTTPSAAITAVLTGKPAAEVTGRGTGVDETGLARKIAVVERALAVNRPDRNDPFDILMKIGGFEIAGMTGVTLAAAANRVPLVMDGLISTVAAALAAEINPGVRDYLIAGHQSVEIGHAALLALLERQPLLNLKMRVGEGTGAALSFALIDAALNVLRDMATFESANVSGRNG